MSFYGKLVSTSKFSMSSQSNKSRTAKLFGKSQKPKGAKAPRWDRTFSLDTKKILNVMGATAEMGKKERLAQGVSGSGKRIKEYSESYKKRKAAIGKSGKAHSLKYSGVLLASLKTSDKKIDASRGLASVSIGIPQHQRWKKNVLAAKGYYISGVTLKTRNQVKRAVQNIGNKLKTITGVQPSKDKYMSK